MSRYERERWDELQSHWEKKARQRRQLLPPAVRRSGSSDGPGQVGCVCTAQVFEYEWNGVLLGPDLVWRTDRRVVRSANRDPDFRNTRQVSDANFDLLVRDVNRSC